MNFAKFLRTLFFTENLRTTVSGWEEPLVKSTTLINRTPEACNFIKTETLAQVFSYEFCEISKNTFFTEHLWAAASAIYFSGAILTC